MNDAEIMTTAFIAAWARSHFPGQQMKREECQS
jgi:hypothetical protein